MEQREAGRAAGPAGPQLRAAGKDDQAAALGKGMWALRKKPETLTGNQKTALAGIAADNKPLYKGYLIKEQLREAFKVKGERRQAAAPRDDRLGAPLPYSGVRQARQDPSRSTGPPSTPPSTTGLSNGRAEALNAQVNALITRARASAAPPP